MAGGRATGRAAVVAAAVVVAGCGGSSSPAPPPAHTPTATAASTYSPPPPLTLPGGAVPAALRGSWDTVGVSLQQLTFTAQHYRVDDAGDHIFGNAAVRGDRLSLSSAPCGRVIGTYRWSVAGGRMRIVLVHDPCYPRRGLADTYRPTRKP